MIPFSPPHIDDVILKAVQEALLSGWITTGPRTKRFEKEISAYCGCEATLCLNSATAGLETILRWYGVGPGDEVIIPAYTYSATANVVVHCGAKPVFVDVGSDFLIDPNEIRKAITKNTKVIMPVDFAGMPCDYNAINALVRETEIVNLFHATDEKQKMLGRILVLSDAAHSIGATYFGKRTGSLTDVSVFSFHAVKNLTTAEGGAITLNLPVPFDNEEVYKYLCIATLHGQNKDALAKTQKGNWRYDIIEAGYKCNMTDIMAAIGLVELERYDQILKKRKYIFECYTKALSEKQWAICPVFLNENSESSYHVYALRIKGVNEATRDRIIAEIFDRDVSVNVHFIPVPMFSFYSNAGYSIKDYPRTFENYSCEISLPVFYTLNDDQINQVIKAVIDSVEIVLAESSK
ncbi:MAG TPA: DegT/DnrJ/EryC1/StrS family aminotransferase [Bacteroidia bacterium]|nr:DegT/DnrJ/EryC1/StrS family aminotransferase [Bacteroidia bacterium]HNT79217.1 DegT/DnrJ/EryC1/StrS family aminotransferase [Bacteroidia bacterium]